MRFIKPGLNVLIDGQFGSTGKGLIAGYIGANEDIDVAVSTAGPNAGHTYIDASGTKYVAYHLPMAGIVGRSEPLIYLGAGSIIDPFIFIQELADTGVDGRRIKIHPRAAVVEGIDKEAEGLGGSSDLTSIGSTRHGVGAALARRLMRRAVLAGQHPMLESFCEEVSLNHVLEQRAKVFLEIPQGHDLGLLSGLSYPKCTSREVSVSAGLSDAQVHPEYLANVMMTCRTFPIRVGHIYDELGVKIGDSGPFYDDSLELSWDNFVDRGVREPEVTTVTKRPRRIATFSEEQYRRALGYIKPSHVFLNFVNYMHKKEFYTLLSKMGNAGKVPTHFGIGPKIGDIFTFDDLRRMQETLWATA